LYRGLVAAWIRDVPSFTGTKFYYKKFFSKFPIVQFATFEYTKRIVSQQFGESSSLTSFLSGKISLKKS